MSKPKYNLRPIKGKGVGLVASQPAEKNTIIETIHPDDIITCDLVYDFYEFIDVLYDGDICGKVVFSFFLAAMDVVGDACRPEHSHVVEYIRGLPDQVHGLVVWDKGELMKFCDQGLVERVLRKKQKIKASFDRIMEYVHKIWKQPPQKNEYRLFTNYPQLSLISPKMVLKYYSIIESRSVFHLSQRGHLENTGALVPIIDKLNHSCEPNCVVEMGSKYTIRCLRDVRDGEELVVCYGAFGREAFVEFYGFLPDWRDREDPSSSCYRQKFVKYYNETMNVSSLQANTKQDHLN